ncbi:MAG: COG1361 S-layer family protein [Candidatus Aenigmatarchaeota archaeon]|nr:MAG: COG1361 S-layer family protein [Candidatus Aenigmarchaeota archaeon]
MLMKNWILCAFSICMLLLAISQGAHAITENLEVVLTKQNPYPVEPDQVFDIEVSLQNTGYGTAEDIVLEILPQNPFTLLPGQEDTKTFSRIPVQDHVTASYKLHVDKNAISNNYELEFRYSQTYSQTGEAVQRTGKVMIQVQGKPKLILGEIETSPDEMEPGDSVTITTKIKNVGTGSASFMEAALVSNTTYILPVLSGGLYYVGEIKPGLTGEAIFEMSVDNSAESKTYSGTLTLTYKDDSGTSQTDSFSIGLPIKGNPVIEVLSAKIDNSAFKVDIENIGTAIAKALKITFVQDGEVKDSSVANELKPTKHKTIRFYGFRQGAAIINVSYLDESNDFFANEFPVTVKPSVYSEEQTGGGGVSPLAPILIVIVVLESYYVWRLRRRMKK